MRDKYAYKTEDGSLGDVYAYVKGRMFGRWIDTNLGSPRSNGLTENGLIENPAYIIESLLRDELFVERDLIITSSADSTHLVCDELVSDVNDYYKYAIIYNVTTGAKSYVTGNSGRTLAINNADGSMAAGDCFFLTNIQGDNKINIASFDLVGNSTNGKRDEWKFARSINYKSTAQALINSLVYESHSMLFVSYDQYKLIALDEGTGDTWANPLYDNGDLLISSSLTPLSNVYSDFRIKYCLDYGSGEYKKEWFVNKNGYTSGGTLGATEQALCLDAYQNYHSKNKYEYSCEWIQDDSTAEKFLIKLVNWFTKQRLMVTWHGDIKTYLKYEFGDQVILNCPGYIPDALNNSAKFMIIGKDIIPDQGSPYIVFNLIQM